MLITAVADKRMARPVDKWLWIRFSLIPAKIAKVVDVRTAPMAERIAAIDDFVAAGY
jgi:hypothetical protein